MKRVGGGKTDAAARGNCSSSSHATMPTPPIVDFLNRVVTALGITATVEVEETADGPRFNLAGEEAELLVRHRGEPLKALQHDRRHGATAARSTARSACSSTRSSTARARTSSCGTWRSFWPSKAKESGLDQQLGPLNPYERRIVHMAVAEVPGRDDRKRRRRVFEDRHDLGAQVAATRVARTLRLASQRSRSLCSRLTVFSTTDTIVAIATPPGRGGIGVVRLSGPDAHAIAQQLITHDGPLAAAPRDASRRSG